MKKRSIFVMAAVIGLSGSMVLKTEAAGTLCRVSDAKKTAYVITGGEVKDISKLLSASEGWCKYVQNGIWTDCPTILLPDCNLPETDIPEIETPEELPEENVSDNGNQDNQPEGNVPDNGNQDISQPEGSVPDNGSQDTNQSEGNVPEENSYARQILKLVNEERGKAGLQPLVLDESISAAARIRAKEIQTSFSHTRPNGSSFSTVLKEMGISYRRAGENIAWGQTSPEQVMQAWMNSEGHRANILNPQYTKLGVGHDQNGSGKNYWVQLFI